MNPSTRSRHLVLSLAALTLFGCEGKIRLDAEEVDLRLDRIEETIPLCGASDSQAAMRTVSRVAAASRTMRASGLVGDGFAASGPCGGSLDVSSEHEHGVTDYVLTMSSFCLQSEGGDVVLDGVVLASEKGKPSDVGPVISAFELSTDGALEVGHVDGDMEVEIDRIRAEYGYPATWTPGVPDEANPDVTTVGEVKLSYPGSDERTDFVRDLRISRTGAGVATYVIEDGKVGTDGDGYADVRTPEQDPLVVDLGALQVQSGTIELHGAGGTVLSVQRDPSQPGVFVVTLDGEPYQRSLDCSDAILPVVQGGLVLLGELPIY